MSNKILKSFLLRQCVIISVILCQITYLFSQNYFGHNNNIIYEITTNLSGCQCNTENYATPGSYINNATFCPNGNLYTLSMDGILEFNPFTETFFLAYPIDLDPGFHFRGIVSTNDSLFYVTVYQHLTTNQWLYRYNKNSGTFINLGLIPIPINGDLALHQGEIYGGTPGGYVYIDTLIPANSFVIVSTLPFSRTIGIT